MTSAKLEFAVQLSCQSCVDAVKSVLKGHDAIKDVSISLDEEKVIVETTLSSRRVQEMIESSGRRAVLQGLGSSTQHAPHLGAAVAMVTGPRGVKGVVRLVQVDADTCVIDSTLDGLSPGEHGLFIHELGDLSNGCDSCGEVFQQGMESQQLYGDLGRVRADSEGRCEFRTESTRVKVWDIIGRSLVVWDEYRPGTNEAESQNRLACGILARSAGLFQNPKRICACDGITIWDERDKPIAGGARTQKDVPD